MYDKKMKKILHDIGQEAAVQELEEKQKSQEEFEGYQRIMNSLIEQTEGKI